MGQDCSSECHHHHHHHHDCDDSVYLGGMLDKMAGECNIDRDEAVKRLGAVLQKQAKRIRIVGKQEPTSNEASG